MRTEMGVFRGRQHFPMVAPIVGAPSFVANRKTLNGIGLHTLFAYIASDTIVCTKNRIQ